MQNDELLPVTQALRLEGFNGAISQAVRALRYLADHDRPSNGEQFPNSASCHMVADELELTMQLFEPAIAAWNTRAAPSGEGRSNGAGEDAADNFRECVAAELAPARDWYAKGQNHEGVLIYLLTNVMADLQSYRSGTYRSGGGTIAVGEVDPEELEDVIDDAISDSFDEEWTSRHGARHIVGAIAHEGWAVVPRAALSAPQGEVERLREAIQQALQCTPRIKINGVSKGITQHKIVYDCGDPWEILRAALAQPEAGGE